MLTRIRQFLQAPTFDGDEEKTNNARLLNNLLVIVILAAVIFPLASFLFGTVIEAEVGVLVIILIAASIGLGILLRFGFVQQTAIILGLVWWALFAFGAYTFGGLHDTSITGFFFLIILIGVVAGWRALLGFAGLAGLTLIGIYFAEHQGVLEPIIYIPSDAADLAMPLVLLGASTFVLRIAVGFLTNAYARAQQNANQLEEINNE